MTKFETKLHHRCRNKKTRTGIPLCGAKLPVPVELKQRAFCCRGCHEQFYRKRCLVCEVDLPARSRRQLCSKATCRADYRKFPHLYRWPETATTGHISKTVEVRTGNADSTGIKKRSLGGRAWRVIAGPALTPTQLHCAAIADGQIADGMPTWQGGEYERIEARNRRSLEAYFDRLDSTAVDFCTACGRDDDLVDHKVADRWVTTCRDCRDKPPAPPRSRPVAVTADDDGLDVPLFLRRPAKPDIDETPKEQAA